MTRASSKRSSRSGAGERAFTQSLATFLPRRADVIVGIGDDAAVVTNHGPTSVLCCDPVIEGVHFRPDTDRRLVGRKAVNRNLADVAAMGAVADHLLVSVVFRSGTTAAARRSLFLGLRAAAEAGGCVIVGGDVAVSDGPLVVTVTAVGHLPGRALLRAGARVGDTLHVSGPLGGSIAGHHLRFRPPLAAGCWLAQQDAVHAAMDVSDGLVLDLQTMLHASGCAGAELDAAALPVRADALRLAGGDRAKAQRRALGDGEDHVLLWSQLPGELAAGGPLARRARRAIGTVLGEPGIWLRHRDGKRERLGSAGYQHDLRDVHRAPGTRPGRHRTTR